MKPFYIEAELSSPVILSPDSYITLDAILAAMIFERTTDAEAAHRDIPLMRTGSTWHGSQAFFESGEVGYTQFTRRMGLNDCEPWQWKPNRGTKFPQIDNARGDFVNVLNSRNWVFAKRVLWFGCGDIARVKDLISGLASIGAKRGQGFGHIEIGSVHVEEISEDRSLSLMGHPSRPIPEDVWSGIGGIQDVDRALVAVDLPTWDKPKVVCALPRARVYKSLDGFLG